MATYTRGIVIVGSAAPGYNPTVDEYAIGTFEYTSGATANMHNMIFAPFIEYFSFSSPVVNTVIVNVTDNAGTVVGLTYTLRGNVAVLFRSL